MSLLAAFDLSNLDWFLLVVCAIIVGMSKTGVAGVFAVVVPTMAIIFGGKDSTGILLPILIIADIFAVRHYNRSTNWNLLKKILPWALLGVVLGTWVGDGLSDLWFNRLLAGIILFGIVVMLWLEYSKQEEVPDYAWFAALMGILSGFTTMVGNLAGPIVAVYLLSMRLPKNTYIGTQAWFFMLMNLFKLPMHAFVWETLSPGSFLLDIIMLPAIALGAIAGIRIVKYISEQAYRKFVIVVTILSVLILLFD